MAKNRSQTINKDQRGKWSPEIADKMMQPGPNNDIAEKKHGRFRHHEQNFDLLVDGVPYTVKSLPFLFNEELRFRIILNGASEHVFTWDSQIGMLRAINDDSSVLPAGLEEAISEKLQGQLK
ncbi:MAG TPA: hypothetical protein VFH08_06955 [Chitinophagaceae bacterium]|nr:hypothetical protein [Chitinophagaceae bacterium]